MTDETFFLAVIGAGNLGSRYLQGLAQSACNLSIVVIDPNPRALALAKQRLAEVKGDCQIGPVEYTLTLDAIKNDLDLAIVATNADVRREVLETLLTRVKVRYLVLEKVVFQCADDFRFVRNVLSEKNITAWVNCPRRMISVFRDCQRKILSKYGEDIPPISLSVIGNSWGLASNSIHFFDLLTFLAGRTAVEIDISGLDQEIYQAKRRGFIELGGHLVAESECGDRISLVDRMREGRDLEVNISLPGLTIELRQLTSGETAVTWLDLQEQSSTANKFRMPFQSELTPMLVDQILIEGSSLLTPLNESESNHIPMLDAFVQHILAVTGKEPAKCSIT